MNSVRDELGRNNILTISNTYFSIVSAGKDNAGSFHRADAARHRIQNFQLDWVQLKLVLAHPSCIPLQAGFQADDSLNRIPQSQDVQFHVIGTSDVLPHGFQ